MKAAAVLLFAAGITTAATLPLHNTHDLVARQDVAAEVIAEADAEAEANDAEAEAEAEADAAAEDANAEDVAAEDEEVDVAADEEDVNVDDLGDINDLVNLDFEQILGLNINDFIDFDLLGLDEDVLAAGIFNMFNTAFPGFLDINSLGVLDAGQLLELMIISQSLFNAQALGFLNQAQLINIFGGGFLGQLNFGFGGLVPVNLGALQVGLFGGLGGFGGAAFSQDAFNGVGVDSSVDVNDILNGVDVADDAAGADAEADNFTAEETADFTR